MDDTGFCTRTAILLTHVGSTSMQAFKTNPDTCWIILVKQQYRKGPPNDREVGLLLGQKEFHVDISIISNYRWMGVFVI